MGPAPVVNSRYDSAPRHPRTFAGVAGRAARALTTAACATIRSDRKMLQQLGRDLGPEDSTEAKA